VTELKNTVVSKELPVVSVVIPTHNRAQLLARALRSVLAQTYGRLEIIVVDDASQDNTKDVVAQFGDLRILYIHHETNKGGSATRNTGIRAATGDFVAFLDDDDEWESEKTEEQLKLFDQYDVVMCTSNLKSHSLHKLAKVGEISLDDIRMSRFTAGGTGILILRSKIIKEMLFDETLPRGQDWDLFLRLAERYKIGYLNKPLVRYDEGSHTRISNRIKNISVEELEKRSIVLEKHKELFGRRWYRRHMAGWLLYGIKYRDAKWRHLAYTVRKCGIGAVSFALLTRIRQKFANLKDPSASMENSRVSKS
jgi:GalNAc5-diNAcBac-PP-undecaprenol beta-1,3-glucosyltransferase